MGSAKGFRKVTGYAVEHVTRLFPIANPSSPIQKLALGGTQLCYLYPWVQLHVRIPEGPVCTLYGTRLVHSMVCRCTQRCTEAIFSVQPACLSTKDAHVPCTMHTSTPAHQHCYGQHVLMCWCAGALMSPMDGHEEPHGLRSCWRGRYSQSSMCAARRWT